MNVPAAEHHVIRNEGFLQLRDRENDFAFPFLFAQSIDSWNAKEIFNDIAIAVGKVAELERKKHFVEGQRRAESSAEAEKKHPTPVITSQRLHRGVVDDVCRFA